MVCGWWVWPDAPAIALWATLPGIDTFWMGATGLPWAAFCRKSATPAARRIMSSGRPAVTVWVFSPAMEPNNPDRADFFTSSATEGLPWAKARIWSTVTCGAAFGAGPDRWEMISASP